MGFNPRLAPYTITKQVIMHATSKVGTVAQNFPLFRFPFAGQLIGAYANVLKLIPAGTAADAAIDAVTGANLTGVSIWKYAAADTTATYATGLRAAIRTGNNDTSTGGGINWIRGAAGTSGINGLYALTNKSATRRKFAAEDEAILYVCPNYAATTADLAFKIDIQMDYIYGYEA